MKNCNKCGAPLEDNAMFCGKCGEKIIIEEINTYAENAPKKHGYFWNIIHYGSLEKPLRKRVLKQSLLGGLACIILITLIPVTIINISKPSDKRKPESNRSSTVSENKTDSKIDVSPNIKDSLLLDWDSTFNMQPKKFLGIVDNTVFFVLADQLYDTCLYRYDLVTKESKRIAKYYQLSNDYNLTNDYIVFFAAEDERGEQVKLMSYNIKNDTTGIAPTFYLDSSLDGKREINLSEENLNLKIIVNEKLYFQLDDYYMVYSFDLQKNVFDVIIDKTVNSSMEIDYKSSIPERIAFDSFDKSSIYYTSNLHHTIVSEGSTYPDYYDEFNLYKYDVTSGMAEKILSLKMDDSEWVYGLSVVKGNVFLQYTSGDIYQVRNNTEIKVFNRAPTLMFLENMMNEDAYSNTGTAFKNKNTILLINTAGNITLMDYSPYSGNLVDAIDDDLIWNGTLSFDGNSISGYYFFDFYKKENQSGISISQIPCPGTYVDTVHRNLTDGSRVTTIYLFVTKDDFKNYPYHIDGKDNLPTGIYAISSTEFFLVDSSTN